MNHNYCSIGGHVCKDVEVRYTPKGTAVAHFDVAVNRNWKNEQGEKMEEVSFFNCVAFGRTAEVLAQYVKKGDPLFVSGRLKQETWEKEGQKRYAVKVIVNEFQFLNRSGGEKREQPAGQPPATRTGGEPSQPKRDAPSDYADADSDIPF